MCVYVGFGKPQVKFNSSVFWVYNYLRGFKTMASLILVSRIPWFDVRISKAKQV